MLSISAGGVQLSQGTNFYNALVDEGDPDPDFDEVAGEKWLILLPEKWNRQVQYSWRFAPCELALKLAPRGVPRPPPRRPQVEQGDLD